MNEMGFAHEVGDRMIIIDEGQVVVVGSPKEIFTKPKHR